MVQADGGDFLIRKQTMIVKNTKTIDQVYRRDAKVSSPIKSVLYHNFSRAFLPKQLGKGTYGEVSACTHIETGQRRAVKVIARSKIKNWERFQTEVRILQTLVSFAQHDFITNPSCFSQDHPNVIKLYEYFEDDTNVYLITE